MITELTTGFIVGAGGALLASYPVISSLRVRLRRTEQTVDARDDSLLAAQGRLQKSLDRETTVYRASQEMRACLAQVTERADALEATRVEQAESLSIRNREVQMLKREVAARDALIAELRRDLATAAKNDHRDSRGRFTKAQSADWEARMA